MQPSQYTDDGETNKGHVPNSSSSQWMLFGVSIETLVRTFTLLVVLTIAGLAIADVVNSTRVLNKHEKPLLVVPSVAPSSSPQPTVDYDSIDEKLDVVLESVGSGYGNSANSVCNCSGSGNQKLCVANCVLQVLTDVPAPSETPAECQQRLHDFYLDQAVLNGACREFYSPCVATGMDNLPLDAQWQDALSLSSRQARFNASRAAWLATRKPGCMDKYDMALLDRQYGASATPSSLFSSSQECENFDAYNEVLVNPVYAIVANVFNSPMVFDAYLVHPEDQIKHQIFKIRVYDATSFAYYVAALRSIGVALDKRVASAYWSEMNAFIAAHDFPYTAAQMNADMNMMFLVAFTYLDPATIGLGVNPLINDITYNVGYAMTTSERAQLNAAIEYVFNSVMAYAYYTAITAQVRPTGQSLEEYTHRCRMESEAIYWPVNVLSAMEEMRSWGDSVIAQINPLGEELYSDYQGMNKTVPAHWSFANEQSGEFTSFRLPAMSNDEQYYGVTTGLVSDALRRFNELLPRLSTIPMYPTTYVRYHPWRRTGSNGEAFRAFDHDSIRYPISFFNINWPRDVNAWFTMTAHELVHAIAQTTALYNCPRCYFYKYASIFSLQTQANVEGLAVFIEQIALQELGALTPREHFATLLVGAAHRFTDFVGAAGIRYANWTVAQCAAYHQEHTSFAEATWTDAMNVCYGFRDNYAMYDEHRHTFGFWMHLNAYKRALSGCPAVPKPQLLRSLIDTSLSHGAFSLNVGTRIAMFDDWIAGGCAPRYCFNGVCNAVYSS